MLPLGLRNNNPGNIEDGPFARSQPGYVGTDGRFAQFASLDHGFNAMSSLYNSGSYKNANTISAIISRWAPASDGNDPNAYSNYVSDRLGIGPNTKLDKSDPAQMRALAQAQAEFENGPAVMRGASSQTITPATGAPMVDQGALYPQSGGPDWGAALSGLGAGLVTAVNPGAGSALQSQFNEMMLANRPKPMVISDMLGQQHIVAVDPRTGQPVASPVRGAQAAVAAQGGSASASPSFDDFSAAIAAHDAGKISSEQLYNSAHPVVQQLAKAYLSGTGDPRLLGMGRTQAGARTAAMTLAHALDPTFTEGDIETRQQIAKSEGNASATQLGGQKLAANTLMGHLDGLITAADRLEKLGVGTNTPIYNKLSQFVTSQVPGLINPDVQAAIKDYEMHLQGAAGELTKVTRGGNGSLKEVEDWKNGMRASDSMAAARAGAAAGIDLMHSRMQSNVDLYNKAYHTGKTAEDFMSPPAKAAFDRINSHNYLEPYASQSNVPKVGLVSKGYRFKGGDPADKNSWEKQ